MAEDDYRVRTDPGEPTGDDDVAEVVDQTDDPSDDFADSGSPTTQVRIAAVEAAVAAGLVPSTSRSEFALDAESAEVVASSASTIELPDWTEAPTGQVPKVLLGEGVEEDDTGLSTRGPSWRQESADWDEEIDLSIFAPDEDPGEFDAIAGQNDADSDSDPFSFGDLGLESEELSEEVDDDQAWQAVLGEPSSTDSSDEYGLSDFGSPRLAGSSRRPHHRRGAHRAQKRAESDADSAPTPVRTRRSDVTTDHGASAPKRPLVATLTGVVVAGVAVGCFFAGAVPSLVLVTVVLMIGAGEAFAVLRRVGFRPATFPGLLVVGALVVGAYLRGASAVPLVLGIGFMVVVLWYLTGRETERPLINIGATAAVICWVGVLGAFAGLLLAPSAHPHRHGIALLVGALIITVAHDVGSYAVGSRFGRRALAPHVSPNKTREGLIGGTVVALVVALTAISHLHPFHLALAFELGIVVAVFAPLGDLVESMIKRDLGVKDMGHLLPGHGGVLDRVDAMLFVLPATYYLVSLHHLG